MREWKDKVMAKLVRFAFLFKTLIFTSVCVVLVCVYVCVCPLKLGLQVVMICLM